MKRAILVLAFSVPVMAQSLVLSTTSITSYRKASGTYPFMRSLYAASELFTVGKTGGGTLTWSASISGELANGCGGSACFAFTGQYNALPLTSGTAPSTVKVNWNGLGSNVLSAGTHTGTIRITPNIGPAQTIAVTLVVAPASGKTEINAANEHYPVGCASSTPTNTFNDICTLQNPQMNRPGMCAPYTDPNFGGTVKRISPVGYAVSYGSNTAFSAKGTYILTGDNAGFLHVFRISDCADITGPLGGHGNIAFVSMSAADDKSWYYMTGATIHKYNFVTRTDQTLGNYGGAPYNFGVLYAGGTIQSSVDDWLSFYDYNYPSQGSRLLCAVNLPRLASEGAPAATNTYCRNILPDGTNNLDWTGIWGIDSGTGKRYVWLSGQPWSALYSVGTPGVLDLVNTAPAFPGFSGNDDQYPCTTSDAHCISSQSFTHSALLRDLSGRAQFFSKFEEIHGNKTFNAFNAASAGPKMFRMAEEPGGGMYFSQFNGFDEQPGSSDALGGVVTAPFLGPGEAFAARVTSATAANPAVLTVTNALSGPTHIVRVDGGTGPWACLNGYWTGTPTGTTVSLAGANCAGAGSFSGQTVVLGDSQNRLQASANSFLGQVVVIVPGRLVKQIAMHRSVAWNDVTGTSVGYYGSTTKSSMSRDGSMVAWVSNFGTVDPQGLSVYIAHTGLAGTTIAIENVDTADTAAVLNYSVPSGAGAATIVISANQDFSNPIINTADGFTGQSRQFVATGLTAARAYYLGISAGTYSTSGTFQTSRTLTGTGTLRIVNGSGGPIRHGPTPALGNSTSSPARLTVNRGLYYYSAGGPTVATVVR